MAAPAFDAVRSARASDFAAALGMACNSAALTFVDPELTAPAFFCLVRAENACGGTLGFDSADAERSGSACAWRRLAPFPCGAEHRHGRIAPMSRTAFVDPRTGEPLVRSGETLVGERSGEVRARYEDEVAVFVQGGEDYAENFGFQWNLWENEQSESRGGTWPHREVVLGRSHLEDYDTRGKSLLECGMGGGDDTEVLLSLPFGSIHSFDISRSVFRARKYLRDPRLDLARASIMDMPFPDEQFDFVWCHRVLQHTPDPPRAMRLVCRKVRPGGVLFVHSYKRSWRYMLGYKYKYRWLTRRVPHRWVYSWVQGAGPVLHRVNDVLYAWGPTRALAMQVVPFEHLDPAEHGKHGMDDMHRLAFEKLSTFDALTPRHDHPMSTRQFLGILEDEGFEVEHLFDARSSPIYATAVKKGSGLVSAR